MRQIVVDGSLVPNDTEAKRQRNVNADVVGINKANEVDYDEVGSGTVDGPKTVKIESTPEGEELYTGDVAEGETATVYWGIKHAGA